jgi:hypothetical protein
MSRPRPTARERMSEWVLHCVNQCHIRRSQPTRKAALKDACDQLLQGHAVNRIVGPNETILLRKVSILAQNAVSKLDTQSASSRFGDAGVRARSVPGANSNHLARRVPHETQLKPFCLERNQIPSSRLNPPSQRVTGDGWLRRKRDEKMRPMSRKTRIRCPLP